MKKSDKGKMFYVFVGCVILSVIIIGATFAYFLANAQDHNTVHGGTYTTSFNLAVERVTTVDMAYGLVPMKNSEAPHAAEQMCFDDYGNAGCQIYKITINGDGDEVFFVDGYLTITPKEGVETRFSRVYPMEITDPDTNEVTRVFTTKDYTKEDFDNPSFDEAKYIKTGIRGGDTNKPLNRDNDYNCLFVTNEQVGGDAKKDTDVYVMIWVYDDGTDQDYLQGMTLAYSGEVTFVTAQGNEIKATFS